MSKFSKRHYEDIAEIMQAAKRQNASPAWIANEFAFLFMLDNPEFNRDRFLAACEPGANVKARKLMPLPMHPQKIAEGYGLYIGHDLHGWYLADESEHAADERGPSVGFNGRPHFCSEEAAANALLGADNITDLLKAD